MSQHDLVIDNGPGINVRLDINQALQSLGSMELGTSAPAPTYPCQRWADLTTGLLKKRNTANTAWLADGKLDVATGGGVPVGGATGAILTKNSAADGDMIWQSTVGFLPTTGGTISGNLTVSGTLNVGGTTVFSQPPQCNVAAGAYAIYYGSVAGARQFYWGVNPAGNWVIVDNTGAVQRFQITPAGAATFANNLTCSGNFNTNQVTGTSLIAVANVQVNPASGAAWYYSLCAGVRQWLWGTNTDGGFYVIDASAGNVTRFRIDTAGNAFIPGTLNVTGALAAGSFTVGSFSAATVIATTNFQCNAASNALFYLQPTGHHSWYVGGMNNDSFYVTDNTAGAVRLIIDGAGTMSINGECNCTGPFDLGSTGVGYTGLSANRVAFQNITGTNLTFYINGVAKGVQTFGTPSDERLKQNIAAPEGNALDELRALKLISYDIRLDPSAPWRHFTYGFLAQQMEPIIPDAVSKVPLAYRNYDDQPPTEDELFSVLDAMPLLARCVGAIQQLSSRIEALEGLLK